MNALKPLPKAASGDQKFTSYCGAIANDKPTVLCFCAAWVEPCEAMKASMRHALSHFGDRINFVEVDADDPKNDQILKQYGIGPLPAVVYLNAANELVSYSIGYSEESAVTQHLSGLLTAHKPDSAQSHPTRASDPGPGESHP